MCVSDRNNRIITIFYRGADRMNEQLTQYIDTIAAKLGVAAEHVYGVLVQQAYVNGIRGLVTGVLLLTITAFLIPLIIRGFKTNNEEMVIFLLLISVIAVVFGFGFTYSGVGELFNPEYYAIRELLDVIKGGD